MKRLTLIATLLLSFQSSMFYGQIDEPVILGYFPSWSESWASTNSTSKLRDVPNFVNYIFLSFARPNMRYTKGSYDLQGTGIQTSYDGCTLKESISALKDKGINVILSVGGETYWRSQEAYDIDYQQIKDLVDDLGLTGIDWDYEPSGSFSTIGEPENIQHFIDFFNNSRAIMPRSEGYILACAPSGVGALGGLTNDDPDSPFAYSKRNSLTGENDTNLYQATVPTNGINLFGFAATGHMIPVMESVGDKIDLIAFQGYNAGASTNRIIMYDSFAYYAEKYAFTIAAGVHYPDEPWGPHFEYTHENVASLSNHIKTHPYRSDDNDGIMIWQILLEKSALNSSAYSYMNVASKVLNGASEANAVQQANDWSLQPYTGGSAGCGADTGGGGETCDVQSYNASNSYPGKDTEVYYNCRIWRNQWWANPNALPGENSVWALVGECSEGEGCSTLSTTEFSKNTFSIYPNPANNSISVIGLSSKTDYTIYNVLGAEVKNGSISNNSKIDISNLNNGIYFLTFADGNIIKLIKE